MYKFTYFQFSGSIRTKGSQANDKVSPAFPQSATAAAKAHTWKLNEGNFLSTINFSFVEGEKKFWTQFIYCSYIFPSTSSFLNFLLGLKFSRSTEDFSDVIAAKSSNFSPRKTFWLLNTRLKDVSLVVIVEHLLRREIHAWFLFRWKWVFNFFSFVCFWLCTAAAETRDLYPCIMGAIVES